MTSDASHGYGVGPAGRPPPRRTNVMAVLALVSAFIFAPLGIVLGVLARRQVDETGEGGRGLATAGLVIGIVLTVLPLLILALVVLSASV